MRFSAIAAWPRGPYSWQLRAEAPARSILMYLTYTAALGNCSMHCSTFGAPSRCIHAIVRAVLSCTYWHGWYVCLYCRNKKAGREIITIFKGVLTNNESRVVAVLKPFSS